MIIEINYFTTILLLLLQLLLLAVQSSSSSPLSTIRYGVAVHAGIHKEKKKLVLWV